MMFGRKQLPPNAPPLGPDDARVVSGEVVTHFEDKQLYDECVRQREDAAARRAGFADVAEAMRVGDELLAKIDADKA